MPAPFHQWMYLFGGDGAEEIFNGARTAAYLANPDLQLPGAWRIHDVLDFGGCEGYAFAPPCDNTDGYLEFRGGTGNNATIPDAANLDITPDITLIADVALDDWTPAAKAGLIGKWTSSGQFSYRLSVTTAGALEFQWTTNGSTINTLTSSANLGTLTAGTRRAVRVDFDGNNGASGRTATFWVAEDHDADYTQLGTAQTSATATTIFNSTSVVMFGQAGTDLLDGKLYWAQVRSGFSGVAAVGGTVVATIDPERISDEAAVTFSAVTGQTATINRSGGTPTLVFLGEEWWEPLAFDEPDLADTAPWYSSNYPESADFLGFHIQEWTGLDDGHVLRQVRRTGRPGGGGQMGPASARERVMKLNVLAIGRSERAVEHGFRWLAAALGNLCAGCETSGMLLRRWCPDPGADDMWSGVVELREVALVEGLTWVTSASEDGGCYVRRLSFTLSAADPCMYLHGDAERDPNLDADATACFEALPLAPGKASCRPLCSDLPLDCRTIFTVNSDALGAIAPIVTLDNDDAAPVPPLRIIAYADPTGAFVQEDGPCGLPILGELYTGVIPPWTSLRWDVAGRRVTHSSAATSDFEPGWHLTEANDLGVQRFFALPCGTAHIVIEPANTCLTVDDTNDRYTYAGWSFYWTELHFPTATVSLQERIGCA